MILRGRSALVTGGCGGLGVATVRRLAAGGMEVVVLDRALGRGEAADDAVPGSARLVRGDVNDDVAVGAAVELACSLGPLSVVATVAGGAVGGGRVLDAGGSPHDMSSFARTMTANLFGTFNVARLSAAAMAQNEPDGHGERGVIVTTASVAAFEGQRGQVAYAAAKAAVVGMTVPMARDLAPVGIRVCALAPGPMATPVLLGLLDRLEEDPAEGIVFPPRLGRPDEFAGMVEAIATTPYLNGECIRLDGALRLAYATGAGSTAR